MHTIRCIDFNFDYKMDSIHFIWNWENPIPNQEALVSLIIITHYHLNVPKENYFKLSIETSTQECQWNILKLFIVPNLFRI